MQDNKCNDSFDFCIGTAGQLIFSKFSGHKFGTPIKL
jgi:hypothetical protein